jgi:hypothetical protein
MLVGGEDHKTGAHLSYSPYERLEQFARARWPGAGEALCRWSSQVSWPGQQGCWLLQRGSRCRCLQPACNVLGGGPR